MRVLVVGSGGREHALAWKLAQEAEVFAAPGNPGIAEVATCLPNPFGELPGLAKELGIDLVLVGPENPLFDGLADRFREADLPTFGPGADGAKLEGSKGFSKDPMNRAGIPTAKYVTCQHADDAKEAATTFFEEGLQVVVKADGLAFGKGVVVCSTLEEALDAIDML